MERSLVFWGNITIRFQFIFYITMSYKYIVGAMLFMISFLWLSHADVAPFDYQFPLSGNWSTGNITTLSWQINQNYLQSWIAYITIAGDNSFLLVAYQHSIAIDSEIYPFIMSTNAWLPEQDFYRRVITVDWSWNAYTWQAILFSVDLTFPEITYTGGLEDGSIVHTDTGISLKASVYDDHLSSWHVHMYLGITPTFDQTRPINGSYHTWFDVNDSTGDIAMNLLANQLSVGTYYRYVEAYDQGGNYTKWDMQTFTIVEEEQDNRWSRSSWGVWIHVDSCPNGDYSLSYYDGSCGETNVIKNITNRIITRWSHRSTDRIKATLNQLSFLNNIIQKNWAIPKYSKQFFQEILDMLLDHFWLD